MKHATILLPAALAVLLCGLNAQASDQASGHVRVHISCKTNANGECPPPPAPPAPPAPPVPPAPPAPPAPPPVPAPVIPDVPAEAHAACASKAPGSALTWELRKGETMGGVCERHDGRMRFVLRSYDLEG